MKIPPKIKRTTPKIPTKLQRLVIFAFQKIVRTGQTSTGRPWTAIPILLELWRIKERTGGPSADYQIFCDEHQRTVEELRNAKDTRYRVNDPELFQLIELFVIYHSERHAKPIPAAQIIHAREAAQSLGAFSMETGEPRYSRLVEIIASEAYDPDNTVVLTAPNVPERGHGQHLALRVPREGRWEYWPAVTFHEDIELFEFGFFVPHLSMLALRHGSGSLRTNCELVDGPPDSFRLTRLTYRSEVEVEVQTLMASQYENLRPVTLCFDTDSAISDIATRYLNYLDID